MAEISAPNGPDMRNKFVPERVTTKDLECGVARLVRFSNASHRALLSAAGEFVELTNDEFEALPSRGNARGVPISGLEFERCPSILSTREAVLRFLATARRCECGKYRQFRMQRCAGCTHAVLGAEARKRDGLRPTESADPQKVRGPDYREAMRDTKGMSDR